MYSNQDKCRGYDQNSKNKLTAMVQEKGGSLIDTLSAQGIGQLEYPVKCPVTSYFWSGFTTLQFAVEHTWLQKKNSSHSIPQILLEQLPKPRYSGSTETVLRSVLPLYMTISISQFLAPMLMVVVLEKERKIKESLSMVGLRDSVFWLSWFFVYGILILCTSILGSLLMNFIVFNNTSSYLPVLFVLMFEFGLSIIMFAFVMTALFSKAKSAGISGGLSILIISLFYYLQVYLSDSPPGVFWLIGLLSPAAFSMSMDKILVFDIRGIPLSVDSIWETGEAGIPLGGAMIMILIDIVLYGFLAAWLDNIIPTEYGTNRPPWFCLLPSYWTKTKPKKDQIEHSHQGYSGIYREISSPDIEAVPVDMQQKEAIVIEDLRKVFGGFRKTPVNAVNGVSLKIYSGEITAILGHNGAGKTTLFNMLTGMTSASGGSAHIFGYDISDPDQMEIVRRMTGICPQHDVLFDELTPREHLQYFGRIRGIEEENLEEEVESILKDIDLLDKGDSRTDKLSGGQKRKLSVGIALIGDPKLIFLDEPTAGVDPYSRRHLWNILKKRKEGKVILLTTHFMDEADILADRKAIISKGVVRCYGSSLFLKNRFGIGYHLTIVLKSDDGSLNIRNMVIKQVPGAHLAREYGRELSFVLPRDKVQVFPQLFRQIEESIRLDDELGISSYGVSMTTLEEVFLHLGELEEQGELLDPTDSQEELPSSENFRNSLRQLSIGSIGEENQNSISMKTSRTLNGLNTKSDEDADAGFSFESVPTKKSNWQTYKALVYVRFIRKFREPATIIGQMIMPLIFVTIGSYLTDLGGIVVEQDSSLEISSDLYSIDFGPTYFAIQDNEINLPNYLDGLEKYLGHPLYSVANNVSYPDILDLVETRTATGIFNLLNLTSDRGLDISTNIFNDTAQHAFPVIINSLSSAYASQYGAGDINLTSQPFRLSSLPAGFDGGSFGGSLLVGMTYIFVPIGFAMELIDDRECHVKNQLRVNGLSFIMYYGSFYTVFAGMLITLLCCLLGLVAIFDISSLMLPPAFLVFASLYFLYTVPSTLFVSCISYLFDTLETGQFLFPISSYAGFIPFIGVFVSDAFQTLDGNLALGLHILFSFISPIYIPFGVIYQTSKKYQICSFMKTCDSLTLSDYMDTEIIILYVAILFHTLLWSAVLKAVDIVKDGGKVTDAFNKRGNEHDEENVDQIADEDTEVKLERDRVAEYFINRKIPEETPVIAVHGLRKVFTSGVDTKRSCLKKKDSEVSKKIAVRNLSMSVKCGEVFGLLGHNGAGKTTTMRIITAEEGASAGKVRIGSKEIHSNQSDAFMELGYCPQFDAQWKTITIEEHLEVFAAIRGVPPSAINNLVQRYMDGLRITEHRKKLSKNCSGGTKRKLSYAMAMLGNPKIVLLDEPSTGMDPQSKRFVWNTIQASFKKERGAVLTTHSMEEADALCSRVGIMVKGELRALGTTQQLKNKYGAGYLLEVKWRSGDNPDWGALEDSLKEYFPLMEVNETFSDRRSYNIPQEGFSSLAQAFSRLETCKSEFRLEDYSFSQTTLEQVFIEFAKQQEAEDKKDKEGDA
ncbi:ATP-binding cassette sub-family A member 9 [Eurytemora carolleeae]|uniref:ATP-binding cassette sub-family A member 9 n=1 Tax=Eurytemora carolleeae TaxID=1294199 RepID=UPI000C76CFC7|nr:ATP-binding cassette sub-family A member 9 [Eurytemora carolleeae]|eukprot:XP_023324416.1 ATP-binding cassette sub-family A member 9-like [Eurytemora affinis]